MVGRRRAAGLEAERAAVRLEPLRDLREVHADVVVLGPDVGGAHALVFLEDVRIPGHHRDPGRHGRLEDLGHCRRVRGSDRDAVNALADEVLDDLELLELGVLARPDVHALDVGLFGLGLVAAVAREVEERVVHRLRHEGELHLAVAVREGRSAREGDGCGTSRNEYFPHGVLLWLVVAGMVERALRVPDQPPRFRSRSRSTARMMKRPMKNCCQRASMPPSSSELRMSSMSAAPIGAPIA